MQQGDHKKKKDEYIREWKVRVKKSVKLKDSKAQGGMWNFSELIITCSLKVFEYKSESC